MTDKKNIAIVGSTGYTGQELTRIILGHPRAKIVALTSRQNRGKAYADLFPQFRGFDLPPLSEYKPKNYVGKADLVFFCLPHAESQVAVGEAVDLGLRAVDLSADFRLRKISDYRRWYGDHVRPDLLKKAVYGMPELYRGKIRKADLVGNPGCYPTGVILGVAPLIKAGLVDPSHVIADMKSGTSGAGRKASIPLAFCEVNEALRAYNLYAHRHTPEMEQELGREGGKKTRVTFSPHLVAMNRGILGTIYVNLTRKLKAEDLLGAWLERYEGEPFIRVLPEGDLPCVSRVRGTNFVDLAVTVAPGGKEAIINTAIDNLVKGAGGSAVQCMNVMLGLPETGGLLTAATRP